VYLGEGETLPMIIANDLTTIREEKLLRVLKENKTVIKWTLVDIKGISPDTTKELMSSPKYRSVEILNNPARPGSNHREVICINYK
jgi:hypothetical protein